MAKSVTKIRKDDVPVLRFRKDRPRAGGGTWFVPRQSKAAGLTLSQDDDGNIMITRAGPRGFVGAYRILDGAGKPLRVEAKYRGARECKFRGK